MEKKLIFACPNKKCINIPELSYSYEPFNPIIKYKCNSNNNQDIEQTIMLNEYLQNAAHNFECSMCHFKIINNNFRYCKKCNKIFDNFCSYNCNCGKENTSIITNSKDLFNKCL